MTKLGDLRLFGNHFAGSLPNTRRALRGWEGLFIYTYTHRGRWHGSERSSDPCREEGGRKGERGEKMKQI